MKRHKQLQEEELISLSRQLSFVIDSDVGISEGLTLIQHETSNKQTKALLKRLLDKILLGETFADALKSETDILPEIFINMVIIGEESGNLPQTLNRIADNYEKNAKIVSKVKAATTYPAILSLLMIGVIILIVTTVLPIFEEVLTSLGGGIPSSTKVIMNFGHFISNYLYVLIIIVVVLVSIYMVLERNSKGRKYLDRIKLSLPIQSGIIKKNDCIRFCKNLSMLIRSGLDIGKCVDMASTTMVNTHLKDLGKQAALKVTQGDSLKDSLKSLGLFSQLLLRVLAVAESTGHIDDMLDRAADKLDNELNTELNRLTTVLEPSIIIVLSIIVAIILISVILPVTNIMNAIG